MCFPVLQCATLCGFEKKLLFYLSLLWDDFAFWIAEGVDSPLSIYFCICKIASPLEITSDFGLRFPKNQDNDYYLLCF